MNCLHKITLKPNHDRMQFSVCVLTGADGDASGMEKDVRQSVRVRKSPDTKHCTAGIQQPTARDHRSIRPLSFAPIGWLVWKGSIQPLYNYRHAFSSK